MTVCYIIYPNQLHRDPLIGLPGDISEVHLVEHPKYFVRLLQLTIYVQLIINSFQFMFMNVFCYLHYLNKFLVYMFTSV